MKSRLAPSARQRAAGRLLLVVLAIALPVAALAVAEGLLRLSGVGADIPRRDPFAGFSSTIPMFEPAQRTDETRVYRVRPEYRPAGDVGLEHREFLAAKPPGGFRVFVAGGSSVEGVPYGLDLAFPAWLGLQLETELPGVPIEVVNIGFSGFATRRLLHVIREIAAHEPDLLVVYSGHNELHERQFYRHLVEMDPRLFRTWEFLAATRLYRLTSLLPGLRGRGRGDDPPVLDWDSPARQMFAAIANDERPTPRELDYRDAMYRFNLREIIAAMQAVGARVLLLTVSQDYADWAPVHSSHREGLSPSAAQAWQRHVERGQALAAAGDCRAALARFSEALAIDDGFADLHFRIAACHRGLGDSAAARRHYRRASDLDGAVVGAPTHFHAILQDLARSHHELFLDVDGLLARDSPNGLVGRDLFADPVHPSIATHQRIAGEVSRTLRDAGIPLGAQKWQVGAFTPPDPAALYAQRPELRLQEHLINSLMCTVAKRHDCALERAEAALALAPDNVTVQGIRNRVAKRRGETGSP